MSLVCDSEDATDGVKDSPSVEVCEIALVK